MNQTVKRIVDILFQDTVENEETKAMHEELMHNCQEHYDDMIARGLSEDEAVGEVVESLKGMKDVIAQYPRKDSGTSSEPAEEEDGEWTFAGIDTVKAETKDQDLYVTPSPDAMVHIYCDDPDGLTVSQNGKSLRIVGAMKKDRAASAFSMPEGEEISFTGLVNMIGKAIRNVTETISGGAAIRIELPDSQMMEIELNSRSGDIECGCAFARRMIARSTSGNVTLEPVTERTAEYLKASAASGEIEVHGSAMDGEVSSMSGDVTVDGVFENLTLKSTSGDAGFTGTAVSLEAASVSGDVEVEIENTSARRINGKSTSGDVTIRLPRRMSSVHAQCSTVSGSCMSRISDAGPDAELQITAKSISGDVTVE
jgi:hypothetical protein